MTVVPQLNTLKEVTACLGDRAVTSFLLTQYFLTLFGLCVKISLDVYK